MIKFRRRASVYTILPCPATGKKSQQRSDLL
nr:MAG TPA: Cytochrome C oxidase assembly factor 2 [Caudoviricetes sp.]